MISRSENFENGARHQELTDQWHTQEALNNYHEAVRQVGPNDRLYRFHADEANRHAREAGLGSGYGMVVQGFKEKAARGKAYEEGLATPDGKFSEKAKNTYGWWSN